MVGLKSYAINTFFKKKLNYFFDESSLKILYYVLGTLVSLAMYSCFTSILWFSYCGDMSLGCYSLYGMCSTSWCHRLTYYELTKKKKELTYFESVRRLNQIRLLRRPPTSLLQNLGKKKARKQQLIERRYLQIQQQKNYVSKGKSSLHILSLLMFVVHASYLRRETEHSNLTDRILPVLVKGVAR